MGKVVGIVSLKGGVGKTSSVVSLGAALAGFGKKVLLVDANFSAPNLGLHLKIFDPEKTLHDVFSKSVKIEDAIQRFGDFDVLPSSVFGGGEINPLKLKEHLRYLKNKYDIVLLDSSPALNDETLSVILASDEILVITTPDHPTITMTLKAINVAKSKGTPISGLVLNKVHNKNFELSLDEIERTSEVPIMAVIPHDLDILRSLSEFTPYVDRKPKSRGSQEYMKLAAVLIGEKYLPKEKFFRRIFTPSRQEINREIFYSSIFN